MSKVEQLRLKILDKPQVIIGEVLGRGDSETKVFRFKFRPLISEKITIYSDGDEVKDSHYDLMRMTQTDPWQVVFNYSIDEGIKITADYQTAAFSDAELKNYLLDADDNLYLAAGNALDALLGDRMKLERWSKADYRIDLATLRRDISDVAQKFKNQAMEES